jgi:CRISPR-associated protein Cmr1
MRKSVPVPNAFLAEGFDLKPRQTILKVRLKLATPMIGGGAESGHPDEHWPIRPTAIRGHLRFWWRAVEGFRHDPAEMRKREIELFGGINPGEDDKEKHGDNQKGSTESKISLSVKLLRDSAPVHVNTLDSIPAYVKNIMTQGGAEVLAIKDCTFIVEISSNQQLSDEEMDSLRRSVLAWIRYGGIGARTRRGAGSLELVSLEQGTWPTQL